MPWDRQSRRRSELPPNWPAIRTFVLERDGHRCRIQGPRCTGHATEVDHVGDRHNHQPRNLRAACHPCHAGRTAEQGHEAMRLIRATGHRKPERHPGLRHTTQ